MYARHFLQADSLLLRRGWPKRWLSNGSGNPDLVCTSSLVPQHFFFSHQHNKQLQSLKLHTSSSIQRLHFIDISSSQFTSFPLITMMESLVLPDHAGLPLEPPLMSNCLPETTGTEYRYRVLVYYAYPDASYSPFSKQNEVQVRFHTHKHIDLDRNVSLDGFRESRMSDHDVKLKNWVEKKMHRFYRKHKTWCVQFARTEILQSRFFPY